MDLSTLDTAAGGEAGAVMELRHPVTKEVLTHEDGRPQTIRIAGYDSPRWRKANREQIDQRIENGRKKIVETQADSERYAIDLLVAATLGWDIFLDGEVPAFTPAAAHKFYSRFIWVREQVDNFAANRANFIKA